MIIKNGKVLNGNFEFINADIKINGDEIEEISSHIDGGEVIDATGLYVVPGFIDTHMHGANNRNFIDLHSDTYETVAKYEASFGTTALIPAVSAAPTEKLLKSIEYINECVEKDIEGGAKIYGVHLEGPFFSVKFKGAHMPKNIRNTDISEFKLLEEAAKGNLKIMTLAPELPGAEDVIRYAVKKNVVISAGHSAATYEEFKRGVEWGVSQGTHLFNAMSPIHHRDPGVAGGLLYENTKCELICDFFHVCPEVVKMVYLLKGREKINMITDSTLATGLPDGKYENNGTVFFVKDGKTRLEDGTINGGTTCLIDGIRNLVSIGIPLEDACMMASKNPAKTAGIYDKVGSIAENKIADLVLLDKDLNIKRVILRGKAI